MMDRQYFDFSDLIDDYSSTFEVVTHTGSGYNDAGDYIEGAEERIMLTGAIIAYTESKVLRSEGAVTMQDRKLHMLEKLPDALIGATVLFGGKRYRIASELENAEFTGVYSYLLKWVSAFD